MYQSVSEILEEDEEEADESTMGDDLYALMEEGATLLKQIFQAR